MQMTFNTTDSNQDGLYIKQFVQAVALNLSSNKQLQVSTRFCNQEVTLKS